MKNFLKDRIIQAGLITSIVTILGWFFISPRTQQTHSGLGDNVAGDKFSTTPNYASQAMRDSPGGIQVQGDIFVNKEATYAVIYQTEKETGNYYQISPTIQASEGILPNRLCIVVLTDVNVTDISRGVTSLGSSNGNTECITSPPKEFTPLITLSSKPTRFELTLVNN